MSDTLQQLLLAFIPVFVAMDAVGNIPFFVALTREMSMEERRRVANVTVLMAAIIILGFVFAGKAVFRVMGITVADFRIAGGILLLVLSTYMLIVGKGTNGEPREVAVFPLASPLVAGPATLTTALMLVGTRGWILTVVSVFLNLAITWVIFRYSDYIERVITRQGSKAFSKVVEILLAAIAVMMIRCGIEESIRAFVAMQ